MMIVNMQHQYPSLYRSPNKSQPDTQTDQSQIVNTPITHSFSLQHSSSKLKSSLCKNYSIHGYCPYGSKCQFAHGPSQLRCNAIANTCYKTKPCFSFLKKEYCPYGHRCNFIHKEQHQEKWVGTAVLQNFPELVTVARNKQESSFLKKLALE